jgi:SAM-dependent methyltransferase
MSTQEPQASDNGSASRDRAGTQLNLGAAKTFIPGFVNIDIHERAEISIDLGCEPLPFADDSVSTIVSHHTLEHVPDYLFALKEIHRVLEHDGELLLSLPYTTLTEHHMVNPYHHHNFNEHSFDFFDPLLLRGSAAEDGEIMFRPVVVSYTYMGAFAVAPRFIRRWSRRHLLNVVRQFDIGLVAIKDLERPVDSSPARADALARRIVELKRARRLYPEIADQAQATGEERVRTRSGSPTGRVGRALRHRRDAFLRRHESRRD